MQPISAVNYFLVIALIAILLFGSALIIRYRWHSAYRRFLLSMFSVWALIMTAMVVVFNRNNFVLPLNEGVLNMDLLLLGLPCFFTLIIYPGVAMISNLLKFKNWLILILPMAVFVGIYFIVHSALGVDPFIKFESFRYILDNITSTVVVLRLMMVAIFITYIVTILNSIKHIVPIYNKWVKENYADSSYNVDWVLTHILIMGCISCCYFLLISWASIYANTIYLISVIALFLHVIDRALFHKTFEKINNINIRWSFKKGWHIEESETKEEVSDLTSKYIRTLGQEVDEWMLRNSAYCHPSFSINNIISDFDGVSHEVLTEVFRSKGENFQSYVRKFRIESACSKLKSHKGVEFPTSLYAEVGFSHYSSFSRAFNVVKGESPSRYFRRLKGLQ